METNEGQSKVAFSGAHRSLEATVHTVGQCKPRNYLSNHVAALVLRRDISLGFSPVDGATGELEIPPNIQNHALIGHFIRYAYRV